MKSTRPGENRAGAWAEGVAGDALPAASVPQSLCRRQSKTVEEKEKNPLPLYFYGVIL